MKHFTSIGYPVPPNTYPIEHYLDLISINYSSKEEEELSRERIYAIAKAYRDKHPAEEFLLRLPMVKSQPSVPIKIIGADLKKNRSASPFGSIRRGIRSFQSLFVRAWRQVTRDKPLNIARFMSSLFVSLLYGAIYNKLGLGASTVSDRLGLLQIAAVSTAMTTVRTYAACMHAYPLAICKTFIW